MEKEDKLPQDNSQEPTSTTSKLTDEKIQELLKQHPEIKEKLRKDKMPEVRVLQNCTSRRLKFVNKAEQTLVLSPLEKNRKVSNEEIVSFNLEPLERKNIVLIQDITENNKIEEILHTAWVGAFGYVFGGFIVSSTPSVAKYYWPIVGPLIFIVILIYYFLNKTKSETDLKAKIITGTN